MINVVIAFFFALFLLVTIITLIVLLDRAFNSKFNLVITQARLYHLLPLILLILFGVIILFTALIYNSQTFKTLLIEISPTNGMGQFGDFFNGVLTPFLTIITIVFLYNAFKQQYKANDLFQNFEIQRSFKDDIEWLRKNNQKINGLGEKIRIKSDDELEKNFHPKNNFEIRETIYLIGIFKRVLERADIEISKLDNESKSNLNALRFEIIDILKLYYIDEFKLIFRRFGRYYSSKLLSDNEYYKENGIDIKYLKQFIGFYNIIYAKENDPTFKLNFNNITQLIK